MTQPAVRIVEVGPRDGLQNEPAAAPATAKIALIEDLVDAGLKVIEAGSFVSAKWVPQMADTEIVLASVRRRPGVRFPVLVPNLKGMERALAAGAEEVAIFAAASESFSQRNINCSIDESLERFRPVTELAAETGVKVRGYLSCVLGCPYEGATPVSKVISVATRLRDLGCYEISLGDTIGVGTPHKARDLVRSVSGAIPIEQIAIHFHDTYGQALANIYACLEQGVSVVDSAVAGLGGCPYAKGASGNVATEDVVFMLRGMGVETGVDIDKLVAAGARITAILGRPNSSKVSAALDGR